MGGQTVTYPTPEGLTELEGGKEQVDLLGNLIHSQMPYMGVLYVRSDVCRQLFPDSTSQWTPLLLAKRFPLLGLVRNLHLLE